MDCEHLEIKWLHAKRKRGCEECDNETERHQGEQTPCSRIVCVACGEDTEPRTRAHERTLLLTS
jgi:hypothetical protein